MKLTSKVNYVLYSTYTIPSSTIKCFLFKTFYCIFKYIKIALYIALYFEIYNIQTHPLKSIFVIILSNLFFTLLRHFH